MFFVWYEVELPYQDKTFFVNSLEEANRMALDLHKDFFLVAVVRRKSEKSFKDPHGSYCVIDRIYRDEKRELMPPKKFVRASSQLEIF